MTWRFTWNGENIWNSIQWKLFGNCFPIEGVGRVNFSKCTPIQTARVHWRVSVLFSMKRRSFFPSKSFSNGKRSKKLGRHPFPLTEYCLLLLSIKWEDGVSAWHLPRGSIVWPLTSFFVDQLTANLENQLHKLHKKTTKPIAQENNNWRGKQNSSRKDRVVYCFFQQTKTKDRHCVPRRQTQLFRIHEGSHSSLFELFALIST